MVGRHLMLTHCEAKEGENLLYAKAFEGCNNIPHYDFHIPLTTYHLPHYDFHVSRLDQTMCQYLVDCNRVQQTALEQTA